MTAVRCDVDIKSFPYCKGLILKKKKKSYQIRLQSGNKTVCSNISCFENENLGILGRASHAAFFRLTARTVIIMCNNNLTLNDCRFTFFVMRHKISFQGKSIGMQKFPGLEAKLGWSCVDYRRNLKVSGRETIMYRTSVSLTAACRSSECIL